MVSLLLPPLAPLLNHWMIALCRLLVYLPVVLIFSNMFFAIKGCDGVVYTPLDAPKQTGAVTINYGLFINAMVAFVVVAFALFMVIKGINAAKKALAAAPAEPSDEDKLLAEIR
jgi:large conductance mechanosensitive channel